MFRICDELVIKRALFRWELGVPAKLAGVAMNHVNLLRQFCSPNALTPKYKEFSRDPKIRLSKPMSIEIVIANM